MHSFSNNVFALINSKCGFYGKVNQESKVQHSRKHLLKLEYHWFSGLSKTHSLTSILVCFFNVQHLICVLMLFYYSLLEVFFFFHMLGNQFCYFRVLTTTSIFRGFQNYLPYLRKEAETQISDQKEGMWLRLCVASWHKKKAIYLHTFVFLCFSLTYFFA